MLRKFVVGAGLLTITALTCAQGSVPSCKPGQLKLNLLTADAAMSKTINFYVLENISHRACQLRGFPKVLLMNDQGKSTFAKPVKQTYFSTKATVKSLVLQPTENNSSMAWFAVTAVDASVLPNSSPVQYTKLQVALPNNQVNKTSFALNYQGYSGQPEVTPLQQGVPQNMQFLCSQKNSGKVIQVFCKSH